MITPDQLDQWFAPNVQQDYITRLMGRVGLTRRRAQCFVRLWGYLQLKQGQTAGKALEALPSLTAPKGLISCTCREAAELFYRDRDRGSERSAGMMIDKLVALGLLRKSFDGNTLNLAIAPLPELQDAAAGTGESLAAVEPDDFDPRCDAIPVATLLATNYNWMNRNTEATPYRIAGLLRQWATQYSRGMRVLRRCDNLNPVGFYLLYPTQQQSEVNFFGPPNKGLHLSVMTEVDPFELALPGDQDCHALFVRSWMIDAAYEAQAQTDFLRDAQTTLQAMRQDFVNLCDLHTLIIHPSQEKLARSLGFQKTTVEAQASQDWM
ncbi:MAG: hypothetical protein AAFW84_26890 [Cyanobacteria bacterium J06635_15]